MVKKASKKSSKAVKKSSKKVIKKPTSKKGINSKQKGSSFERDICKKLSLWWTNDKRDDVLWRSASSGGRSTQRSKKGKSTANSAGDISALDPIAQNLLDCFSFELKSGYDKTESLSLLDTPDSNNPPMLVKWIQQAEESKQMAGSKSWVIIFRRTRRLPVVILPYAMLQDIRGDENVLFPDIQIIFGSRYIEKGKKKFFNIAILTLDTFIEKIKPSLIKAIVLRDL